MKRKPKTAEARRTTEGTTVPRVIFVLVDREDDGADGGRSVARWFNWNNGANTVKSGRAENVFVNVVVSLSSVAVCVCVVVAPCMSMNDVLVIKIDEVDCIVSPKLFVIVPETKTGAGLTEQIVGSTSSPTKVLKHV